MNYFAPYNKELGFKISIDGFHNTPHPIPYGVILSMNPPGSLYDPDVQGPYPDVSIHVCFLGLIWIIFRLTWLPHLISQVQ